jgi:outer membrane immunogenic protein
MRKSTMALAMAVFAGSGAQAADLGGVRNEPPPFLAPPPAFSWTGLYLGGHAGYAWGNEYQNVVGIPFAIENFSPQGAILGGQVGYNWQVSSWLVLGAEASIDWSDISDDTYYSTGMSRYHTNHTTFNWLADATGRVGVVFNRAMVYGKGGVAWTSITHSTLVGEELNVSNKDQSRTGWLIGGGVEYALNRYWSISGEYDYIDFGSDRYELHQQATGTFTHFSDYHPTMNVIKVGINYKIGGRAAEPLK